MLNSDRLPMTAQRALSFLPLKVDPTVRLDAEGSTQWRLDMWQVIIPEIPKYLLLGKAIRLTRRSYGWPNKKPSKAISQVGKCSRWPGITIADHFRLSCLSGFGVYLALSGCWARASRCFIKTIVSGIRPCQKVNTFFLAYFITETIIYFTVFGAFNSQLYIFTGVLGMSVALNGGVLKAPRPTARKLNHGKMQSAIPAT